MRSGYLVAIAALALGLHWPGAALSEQAPDPAAEPLRASLSSIPMPMMGPLMSEGGLVLFGDLDAARELIGAPDGDPLAVVLRAWPPGWLANEMRDMGDAWRDTVGFAASDVARAITVQALPRKMSVVWLSPGRAGAVGPALAALGYEDETRGPVRAWATGEDDSIDIATRNLDDPFRGGLGQSARVWVEGDVVRHATTWAMAAMLAQAHQSPASAETHTAALLTGLSGLGSGALIRAALLPRPPSWLQAQDPLEAATGQPRDDRVQTWRALALADFWDGTESVAVLALILSLPGPDAAAQAKAIVAEAQRRWVETGTRMTAVSRSWPDLTGAIPAIQMLPAGGDLWVLRLILPAPDQMPDELRGRGTEFEQLLSLLMMGDIGFLPGAL